MPSLEVHHHHRSVRSGRRRPTGRRAAPAAISFMLPARMRTLAWWEAVSLGWAGRNARTSMLQQLLTSPYAAGLSCPRQLGGVKAAILHGL